MVFGWGMLISFFHSLVSFLNQHCANKSLGESQDAYNQVQNDDGNQASFGHEALAGAASFGAFKIFEDRQRAEGQSSIPTPTPNCQYLNNSTWSLTLDIK